MYVVESVSESLVQMMLRAGMYGEVRCEIAYKTSSKQNATIAIKRRPFCFEAFVVDSARGFSMQTDKPDLKAIWQWLIRSMKNLGSDSFCILSCIYSEPDFSLADHLQMSDFIAHAFHRAIKFTPERRYFDVMKLTFTSPGSRTADQFKVQIRYGDCVFTPGFFTIWATPSLHAEGCTEQQAGGQIIHWFNKHYADRFDSVSASFSWHEIV